MKKIVLVACLLLLIAIVIFVFGFKHTKITQKKISLKTPTKVVSQTEEINSLFIPYWSLNNDKEDIDTYDQLIYFGIVPTLSGINTEESGYKQLSSFSDLASEKQQQLLVLRMLDSQQNFAILKDTKIQKLIIADTVKIAKTYGFDGIVLDLELSALPFASLIQQINTFSNYLSQSFKREDLTYSIAVYGDSYYRVRPFDVKVLAESADSIMIMAYDLSKAGGNPGPNFPMSGKEQYGYDYSLLVDKLLAEVPVEKITVIFGLYGYDWQVDEKNITQKPGKPLSYFKIKADILDKCAELSCRVRRDELSAETTVSYIAADGSKHTVWYEDMESVAVKQYYLKSKGIYNFSYWAYSYF